MKAYRVQKKIAANGELKLNALPFQEGDEVEVIILSHETVSHPGTPSPLRGKVIEYLEPGGAGSRRGLGTAEVIILDTHLWI